MDSSRTLLLLFLILHLSDTKGQTNFETVREGDNITLSCKNENPDQSPCGNTEWNFTKNSIKTTLFSGGQKNKEVTSAAGLSENCSLVLKDVTEEDIGYYYCRQFTDRWNKDTNFQLFVVKLSQEKKDDRVTFRCSVVILGLCKHTVKWLNNDTEVNKDHSELQTSHSYCGASVSFLDRSPPSQFYQSLKCEVKLKSSEKKVTVIPRPPDDKRPTEESQSTADLLRPVVVSVGLVALLISVAAVLIWTRTKGINTERSQHHVDREGLTVEYENVGEPSVSVRFNKSSGSAPEHSSP